MIKAILKKFLFLLLLFCIDSICILLFHQNYFSLLFIFYLTILEKKDNAKSDIIFVLLFLLLFLIIFNYNNFSAFFIPIYYFFIYKQIKKYILYSKYRYLIIKLILYFLFLYCIYIDLNIYTGISNFILLLLF